MTRAGRSALMARITGDNLRPEKVLASELVLAGVRSFARNVRSLPGTPDFVFRAGRLAVFVDGCFWHGCPRHYRAPKSRAAFWRLKLAGNMARDRRVRAALRRRGWRTMTVWEHEIRENARGAALRVAWRAR